MSLVGFCDDEKPRRVLVNAVNDAGADDPVYCGKPSGAMKKQCVDKRSVGIAVCGVDNHSLRLVDDEQTVVFIYNIKRDVLWLRVVRLGLRELKTDGFTA